MAELPTLAKTENVLELRSFAADISRSVRFSVARNYLDTLHLTELPKTTRKEPLPEAAEFLKFERIGHGSKLDNSFDLINLQNILGTFRNGTHALVSVLNSEYGRASLFMGAQRLPRDDMDDSDGAGDQLGLDGTDQRLSRGNIDSSPPVANFLEGLRSSLRSHMPGTTFHAFPGTKMNGDDQRTSPFPCDRLTVAAEISRPIENHRYVAAITGIPSLRGERADQSFQSLDRFIEAMLGHDYTLMVIAEPVSPVMITETIVRCEELISDVHGAVKTSISACESIAKQESEQESTGTGTGTNDQTNIAEQEGDRRAIIGPAVGAALIIAAHAVPGVAFALGSMGSSAVQSIIGRKTKNRSEGRSVTISESSTKMKGVTASQSQSRTAAYEHLNKAAESTERLLNGFHARFERAKALGLWQTGVYFFAPDLTTLAHGQAQLMALYSGSQSQLEPVRSVLVGKRDGEVCETRNAFGRFLSRFQNPAFDGFLTRTAEGEQRADHPLGPLFEALATPLTTDELAVLLNLPRREVPGIKLQHVAEFGLNPPHLAADGNITLGKLMANGVVNEGIFVRLATSEFARHAFLTGITGAGKTNTAIRILRSLHSVGTPFMVLEPAKTEYRQLLSDPHIRPTLRVFTLGEPNISPFRLNPFEFVPGTNLLAHIDTLKSIFNAAFNLFPPLPYVLEEAIVTLYDQLGWNLETSENAYLLDRGIRLADGLGKLDRPARDARLREIAKFIPKLKDLYDVIDEIVEAKGYAAEVERNTKAALKARIGSLRLGSKGMMLDVRRGLSLEDVFGGYTILEMQALADDDEKAFILALLTTRLYQYRMQQYREKTSSGLTHLCVLEEAHRLLRKVEAGGESGNPRGKAVEMFASVIAEIRKYGQGFLIADQSPGKLIPDVLNNTNIKIMHRLVSRDDRNALAWTMGLNEEQQEIVSHLAKGEAILSSNDLDKPIWTAVDFEKLLDDNVQDGAIRDHMAPYHADHGFDREWEAQADGDVRALQEIWRRKRKPEGGNKR